MERRLAKYTRSPNTLESAKYTRAFCRIHSNRPRIHWSVFGGCQIHLNPTKYTRTAAKYTRTVPNTLERQIHSNNKSDRKSKKNVFVSKKHVKSSQKPAAKYTRTRQIHSNANLHIFTWLLGLRVARSNKAVAHYVFILQTSLPVRMSAECLQNVYANVFTRLSGRCWNACKHFSNAAELLSGCFGNAKGLLADSALKNDHRMRWECWQTDALLLPDELLA